MDSKNIHIACYHMKTKNDWEKYTGNEWSFVGDGASFKEQEVNDFIQGFFKENEIYMLIDRHNSFCISRGEAAHEVCFIANSVATEIEPA